MHKLLLIISFCFSFTAEARSIGKNVTPGAPPQACVLQEAPLSTDRSKFRSFCSGTLVFKNKILTAAHCVESMQETAKQDSGILFRARCNSSSTYSTASHSFNVSFAETHNISKTSLWVHPQFVFPKNGRNPIKNDTAIVEITTDSSIDPAEIASADTVLNLSTGKFDTSKFECRISGYGVNAENTVGVPQSINLNNETFTSISPESVKQGLSLSIAKSASIDAKNYKAEETKMITFNLGRFYTYLFSPDPSMTGDGILSMFNQMQLVDWAIMSGDSGGGVMCRNKSTSKESVIAVTSASQNLNLGEFYDDYLKKDASTLKVNYEFSPPRIALDKDGKPSAF